MNAIAMGVMSHNHPETVKEVLSECADIYRACELDVYYYDSSENEVILDIIEKYRLQGYSNLHYVDCRKMTIEQKQIAIWNGYGMEKKYDYHWLVKDRTAVDGASLLGIYKMALFDKPDMIVIDTYGDHSINLSYVEEKPIEIYQKYAWEMTSMDTVILRKSTFIGDLDLQEPVLTQGDYRYAFMHYDMYFRRLSEMKNPRIGVLSEPLVKILNSMRSGSGWYARSFEIWADMWVKVNEALPDIYDPYKKAVVKSRAVPKQLQTEEGLLDFRRKGVLRPEMLTDEIRNNWNKISIIPYKRLEEIAGMSLL